MSVVYPDAPPSTLGPGRLRVSRVSRASGRPPIILCARVARGSGGSGLLRRRLVAVPPGPIGVAVAGPDGRFEIPLGEANPGDGRQGYEAADLAEVILRVFDNEEPIKNAEHAVGWDVWAGETEVVIEVGAPRPPRIDGGGAARARGEPCRHRGQRARGARPLPYRSGRLPPGRGGSQRSGAPARQRDGADDGDRGADRDTRLRDRTTAPATAARPGCLTARPR